MNQQLIQSDLFLRFVLNSESLLQAQNGSKIHERMLNK